MGQYYSYGSVKPDGEVNGFSPSSAKEMEHSYIGNTGVITLYLLLADKGLKKELFAFFENKNANKVMKNNLDFGVGSWCGRKAYHAGDYDSKVFGQIPDGDTGTLVDANLYDCISYKEDLSDNYSLAPFKMLSQFSKDVSVDDFKTWDVPAPLIELFCNFNSFFDVENKSLFLLNHTTNEAIDIRHTKIVNKVLSNINKIIESDLKTIVRIPVINLNGLDIDPVSLLISKSDDDGGGDFIPETDEMERNHGLWAGNELSLSRTVDQTKFNLVDVYFQEGEKASEYSSKISDIVTEQYGEIRLGTLEESKRVFEDSWSAVVKDIESTNRKEIAKTKTEVTEDDKVSLFF